MFLIILYTTFVITLLFGTAVAGILILLPAEASKANLIGYYSTCAFAPISSIILFSLTFVGFILLMKLWRKFAKKSKKSVVYEEFETILNQK